MSTIERWESSPKDFPQHRLCPMSPLLDIHPAPHAVKEISRTPENLDNENGYVLLLLRSLTPAFGYFIWAFCIVLGVGGEYLKKMVNQ